jgi:hypothetical protein
MICSAEVFINSKKPPKGGFSVVGLQLLTSGA